MFNQLKDNSQMLSPGAAAAGARNETNPPAAAAITTRNTTLDAGVMPQRSLPSPSLYPNHHHTSSPESTAIELTLSMVNSNEIVSHFECIPEVELSRTNTPESTLSLECFQVDPSFLEEHERIFYDDLPEVNTLEDSAAKENMPNESSPQISTNRSKEASQFPSSAVLHPSPCSPKKPPSLPVELHYLGKKKNTSMKREAIMGMKEQLAEDDYLRKLCTELQLLQYDRTLTTADRYRRLRAKQNEILYYRNQDMVAEFYNGRVVKNNGSDFIMLPGKTIPKNLPDGFTFGLRGSADQNGKRDVLLIQKIKEVHGL